MIFFIDLDIFFMFQIFKDASRLSHKSINSMKEKGEKYDEINYIIILKFLLWYKFEETFLMLK